MVEIADDRGNKLEWPWDWRGKELTDETLTEEIRLEIVKNFFEYVKRATGTSVASEGFQAYCKVAEDYFERAIKKARPSLEGEPSEIAREASRVLYRLHEWVGQCRLEARVSDEELPYLKLEPQFSFFRLRDRWNAVVERLNVCMGVGGEKGKNEPSARGTDARPKRKRPKKADMGHRNRAVAMAAARFQAEHDRLPTVDEIIAETKYTRPQIYATAAYREGKIAKSSAKAADEMTGGSVQRREYYGEKSEEHGRAKRRSESEQSALDALIDEQKEDTAKDEKQKRIRKKRNTDDA